MTHNEKIDYMRISAGVCGFSFQQEHLDLLVSIYELILEKKGSAKLDDIVCVEQAVKERWLENMDAEKTNDKSES